MLHPAEEPTMARPRPARPGMAGCGGARRCGRAVALLAALPLALGTVAAQTAGHTLTGFAFDSITRSPLRGAVVQLVALDSAARAYGAVADSLGAYRIADL